jgi:hypothetical protein
MACNQSTIPPVVNVTVNNSCGGSGSNATAYCVNDDGVITINPPPVGDMPILPPTDMPPDMPEYPEPFLPNEGEPPTGWDDWESFDSDACAAANGLVEMQYQFWRRTADFFGQDVFTMAAYFVVVWNLFAGQGWSLLFKRDLAIRIADIVGRLSFLGAVGAYTGGLADDIAENRQELVCELYVSRGNTADWANLLSYRVTEFIGGYLQAGVEMNMVQELIAFTLPPVMGAWMIGRSLTTDADNYVSCVGCVPEPTGLYVKDWTPTGATFIYSSDGVNFNQVHYSTGIPVVFGDSWYMRQGVFYISETETLNDTPRDGTVQVTNMQLTPLTVWAKKVDDTTETKILTAGESYQMEGAYFEMSGVSDWQDRLQVSILSAPIPA